MILVETSRKFFYIIPIENGNHMTIKVYDKGVNVPKISSECNDKNMISYYRYERLEFITLYFLNKGEYNRMFHCKSGHELW